MKRRRVWIAAAAVLALALALFFLSRPSLFNTIRFHSRHQPILEDFISLCRAETEQHDGAYRLDAVYTDWFSGVLMCRLDLSAPYDEREFPASPELTAVWEEIEGCGYFTSVGCSFDESGALEIHFSTEGEWIPYGTPTEGHYYIAYCLVWRDTDYSGLPHARYWNSLGEAREQGGWYYTSHKHRDG